MLILKPFLYVYNSHNSTQPLAGGRAGGFEWTVRVRLLSSKAWSHGLAEGSTNICEMGKGEQGRKEPSLWCQVIPLMFPATKPDLAVLTTSQSLWCPVALTVTLPSSLRREFLLGSKKKHIGNGTARSSAFLLPTLCMPCEKEVCLKSSPALKNRNGHGTSQCSLNWDWILIFFGQTSSLEDVWALNLGSWHFRNTTFWSASLEPVKTLQIKPDLWFSPLPYWAALISEPWVYQTEAALLPPTEKYCHQDDVKQGNFAEALIWNVLFQGRFFAYFHVYI